MIIPRNPAIKTRFVILSAARSGSTALTSTLKTHPEIYCFGSPFFAKDNAREFPWAQALPDGLLDKRKTDPVGYAYDLFNITPGPAVVGYKLWGGAANNAKDAIATLAADRDIKKILLNRKNHLACFSSSGLVQLSKQGTPASGIRPLLDFDATEFALFTRRRTSMFERYRTTSQGDVIELPYTGLMTAGLATVCTFLGVSAHRFTAQTNKRNSSDILARYRPDCHADIHAALDKIGQPDWVSEGAGDA